MSANKRNFWILLTTFALTFAAAQWLGRSRTHVRTIKQTQCNQNYSKPYKCDKEKRKKRKKKKKCGQQIEVYRHCDMNVKRHSAVTPSINDFVFADQEPKPLNLSVIKKKVSYPTLARQAGIEGKVVVRVLVDEFGNYRDHKIILRSHPILSNEVERHIRGIEFIPAKRDGKAIQFWTNIPFTFRLPS